MLPSALPTDPGTAYVIGTEACYGAKPTIKASGEQSILITALQNRCVGFLGSTQIAYGIGDDALAAGASPSCADVLVGRFMGNVANGYALGDAYVQAFKTLSAIARRQEQIKTLCSFALYGDPSAIMFISTTKKISSKTTNKNVKKPAISISQKLTSTRGAVPGAEKVDLYVKKNFKSFADVKAEIYKVPSNNDSSITRKISDTVPEYKSTYAKTEHGIVKILHIYFDQKGKIENVYISR
jgi:hypothetical protein